MYVAGDAGTGSLDDYRRPGRQHLLRRHLSGADLGRLHGDGHRGPAVKEFDPPAYVNPRRRRRRPRRAHAGPEPTTTEPTKKPTASAPPGRRESTPSARTASEALGVSRQAAAEPIPPPSRRGRRRRRQEAVGSPGGGRLSCRPEQTVHWRSRRRRRLRAIRSAVDWAVRSAGMRSPAPAGGARCGSRCWSAPSSTWPVSSSGCRAGRRAG